MLKNRFKKQENKKVDQATDSKLVDSSAVGFKSMITGSFLSKDVVVQSLPFIFFLTFLGIVYIANGYQMQRVIVQLNKTGKSLKELRSEYITTKSDLMIVSKQSRVAAATESVGLKELTSPPKKIVLTQKEKESILDD